MAREQSPAFQFYPKDFLVDEQVCLMSYTERGIYITLMCWCWLEQSLPSDVKQLAKLLGLPVKRFQALWLGPLGSCFLKGDEGRLQQKRLEQERTKQQLYRQDRQQAGRRGASSRWLSHTQLITEPSLHVSSATVPPLANDGSAMVSPLPNDSSAMVLPLANNGSSSPISNLLSPISLKEKKETEKEKKKRERLTVKKKRPRFTGQRIVVFDWQHEKHQRILGKYTDAFDLDTWYRMIDQKALQTFQVLPTRDGGAWLENQLLAEAKSRQLKIVDSQRARPISQDEIHDAKLVREAVGGCQHDPPCQSSAACEGEIIRRWRYDRGENA